MGKRKFAIGIDIGGTNVRAGIVSSRGKIVACGNQPVGDGRRPKDVIDLVARLIGSLRSPKNSLIIGAGCGIPGIVDARGVVGRAPHYPLWEDVPMRRLLEKTLRLKVFTDNDANMNAVGEHRWGAARDFSSFVMLTLGTGIGGGIVINGAIYRGERGYAGEIGHMTIERSGFACECGNRGCWEEYAANGFFRKFGAGAKEFERRARSGESSAITVWREYGRNVGIGIATLMNVLGITNFVIGGGVSRASKYFFPAMRDEIRRRSYPQNFKNLDIRKSTLVDKAGVLGAAAAVFESVKQ